MVLQLNPFINPFSASRRWQQTECHRRTSRLCWYPCGEGRGIGENFRNWGVENWESLKGGRVFLFRNSGFLVDRNTFLYVALLLRFHWTSRTLFDLYWSCNPGNLRLLEGISSVRLERFLGWNSHLFFRFQKFRDWIMH